MVSVNFAFDPFSPEYERDPHPVCRHLRENLPAYWWPAGPAWLFSRYEDVAAILKDRRISSDPACWEHAPASPPDAAPSAYQKISRTLLFGLSPTAHARVRRLVMPAFTSHAMEHMRADVEAIVASALPSPGPDGTLDVVRDYAAHIPMRVLCGMLRVPGEMIPRFERFAPALFSSTNPRLTPVQKAANSGLIEDGIAGMRELITDRRERPGDDLLSTLVLAEEQGDRLSHDELIGLLASLVAAGLETTIQHISYSVFHLLRHPEQLRLVQDDPSLMRNAIDEVLRYDFFARTGPSRFATEDIDLNGFTIEKGQMVLPMLTAAMRDPAAFPDPDRFDVRRDQTRNVAFGGGPHRCTGANLARLQVEIAVAALFRRFPRMQLAGERTFAPDPTFRTIHGLRISVN
jgi:cytochrome P450 enzyme